MMKLNQLRLIADPSAGGGGGAPLTPNPAPAAPAKQAELPAMTDKPPAGGGGAEDDPFDAMDARITARRGKTDDEKAKETAEKAAEKPPEKPDGAEKPKEGDKPPEKGKEEPAKTGPKPLRDELERTKGELKTRNDELGKLKTRIIELEKSSKDNGPVVERLKAVEKERDDLAGQIRALKQEASPEFKQKWDAPFDRAAEYAKNRVEQLLVTAEDGTTRQATWADFVGIYQMPAAKAIERAQEVFGQGAGFVMSQIDKLQQLDFDRRSALEDEKKTWKAKDAERKANAAKEREEVEAEWVSANKEIAEKSPEWFGEEPEDTEGNDLLKLAYSRIDEAFASIPNMTPKQRVKFHAQLRNRAAAFPRLVLRLNRANEKLKELEGKLADKNETDPNLPGRRGSGQQTAGAGDWRSELRTEIKE